MDVARNANFAVIEKAEKNVVAVPSGTQDIVLWGPYQRLNPGHYEVVFEIEPTGDADLNTPCCEIDVACYSGRTTVFRRRLSVKDILDNNNKIAVVFTADQTHDFEYRVFAIGGAAFDVTYMRKASPVGEVVRTDKLENSRIYAENLGPIDVAREAGVQFSELAGVLTANVDGIEFDVQSQEDIQLLNEVFLSNEYNVIPPHSCVVIDVGMNIGLASLAFASNPNVEAVHSYEPFKVPFDRAGGNFARNAQFGAKISPNNFGLADRDETLEVNINPAGTISTSIRGFDDGEAERIDIRDAAAELGPKIDAAIERGLGVVMKVDCEGSEFAIFESLERAGLFPKIDAFMLEWHKWWSVDKTQADLIAPLRAAGFIVFDRTNPGDPYAGFLYAVRSAWGVQKV